MNPKQYDLTNGTILNKLLLITLPIMGTQLLQMTYNLTDMFWLGRLSSDAVAATGTSGMYIWMSAAFLMIGRTGAEIGVSQFSGRGELDKARKYGYNSLLLAVILGILFTLVMIIFRHPLIGFFNIREAHVARDAAAYLAVVALGIPATFISGTMNGIFNGTGNSRSPFYINALGLIINMILDPLFILYFDMGVIGAAVATITGQFIVCIVFIIAAKFSKNRPFDSFRIRDVFRPETDKIKHIFKWSIPLSMESLLFTCLSMIISRFVSAYGAGSIAVQRVGSQVESLTWLIGVGFSSALTAFVGQNFGAAKWDRIRQGFRLSAWIMSIYGLLVSLLLFFAAGALFGIFLPGPDLLQEGVDYLRILAVCQIATCLEAVAAGAFRGIGKTVTPSAISILSNTGRVFLAYGLSRTDLGINGIWWGITIGAIVRGVLTMGLYLLEARKQPG